MTMIHPNLTMALNLRNSGKTYKEIGKNLNVSTEKARRITAKAKRLNRENYDNDTPKDQEAPKSA
jgi:orotate phosphoribosyltransferase-like protein